MTDVEYGNCFLILSISKQGSCRFRRQFEPRNEKNLFPGVSNKNRAVQPQKKARDMKFRILEVVGVNYLWRENGGAS